MEGGCRRQVWRRKTSREAEDASGGGRHIGRRKMHRKADDASEGGRCVGRRKIHQKAEEAPEAEAEFETEGRGGRGFPLQIQPSHVTGLVVLAEIRLLSQVTPCLANLKRK